MHVVGLLPDPPRCPPCRGAGRRTRNGPDGPRPQAADNKVPGHKVPEQAGTRSRATRSRTTRSRTLAAVSTANTRLERHFDPTAVHELKAAASTDLTVGGANLAARAFKAGLVDECQLFVWPMVVGGASRRCRPTRAPTSSSSMSADSETASYTSPTALWDSDRQPCPIRRRASMTRGALMADRPGRISTPQVRARCSGLAQIDQGAVLRGPHVPVPHAAAVLLRWLAVAGHPSDLGVRV